jgi:hypothetical protein
VRIALLAALWVLLGWLAGYAGAEDPNALDANAPAAAVETVDVKLPASSDETSIQEMIRRLNAAGAGAGLADTARPIPSGSDETSVTDAGGNPAKTTNTAPPAETDQQPDANSNPAELLEQIKKIAPDTATDGADSKTPAGTGRKRIDLKTLPEDTVKKPIQLADVLYLGGHYKAAATFYVMVTDSQKQDYSNTDKAWALYQLGNCQRRYDPSEAKVTYKRLIEEYSTSSWVAASQVQQRLLTWKLSSKPEQLVKKHRKTGMDEVTGSDSDGDTKEDR